MSERLPALADADSPAPRKIVDGEPVLDDGPGAEPAPQSGRKNLRRTLFIIGPVVALLAEMGIPFERQFVKFNPRRCVGMPDIRVAADLRVTTK